MTKRLPKIGLPTNEEKKLTNYLGNKLDDYIEQNYPVDRRTLIAALFHHCFIVFCKQTPLDKDEQYNEIEEFCYYLKKRANEE